jgi:6-phosphogluconolactonase (cycloisomerase 2 family)
MALHILNTDNVTDDPQLALDEATFATTAVVAGTTYLFVTGYADAGVSAFAVAPDGTLTNVDNVFDDDGTPHLGGASGVTTAVIGGNTYLFVAGYLGNGVLVLSVAADGTLTHADHVWDSHAATLELRGAFGVTTAVVGGNTYLFVTGAEDDGVSVFRVAPNGTLANVFNVVDDATLALERPMGATTAVVGGVTYLFVAGATDDGGERVPGGPRRHAHACGE